jgi:hypothetical protein
MLYLITARVNDWDDPSYVETIAILDGPEEQNIEELYKNFPKNLYGYYQGEDLIKRGFSCYECELLYCFILWLTESDQRFKIVEFKESNFDV